VQRQLEVVRMDKMPHMVAAFVELEIAFETCQIVGWCNSVVVESQEAK
jgi:hypothetical protein